MNISELPPLTQSILLLFAVIGVKRILLQLVPHQPFEFFAHYCQLLADKVNKPEHSISQQKISGFVATVITVVPIITILGLFENLVATPWLWHSLLLYLAIDGLLISYHNQQLSHLITAKQRQLAKQSLQPYVLRTTEPLSSIGLSKAAIEMQVVKSIQLIFVPCFLYLLAGPLTALAYRIILEMHYAWNIKKPAFQYFGYFSASVILVIEWLPSRLFSLLLLSASSVKTIKSKCLAFSREGLNIGNDLAIELMAMACNIELGGVAKYGDLVVRKKAFNIQAPKPNAINIVKARSIMNHLFVMLIFLLSCLAIFPVLLK